MTPIPAQSRSRAVCRITSTAWLCVASAGLAHRAEALPTIVDAGHIYENFGPNSLPGYPVGNKVQVYAIVASPDPFVVGNPSVAVEAKQGIVTLPLPWLDDGIFVEQPGYHAFSTFFDYDPERAGPWQLVPKDSTGTGSTLVTNDLSDPVLMPLLPSISIHGTPQAPIASWTLPDLTGFEVEEIRLRMTEAETGTQINGSLAVSPTATSYQFQSNLLVPGVEYVVGISLLDYEGSFVTSRSVTFSAPFRFTLAGDYNSDGVVDAADYTVWRNHLGSPLPLLNDSTTGVADDDFTRWKFSYGDTFGGEGQGGLPIAARLHAPSIPEPDCWSLYVSALLIATARHGRGGRFPDVFWFRRAIRKRLPQSSMCNIAT